MADDSHSVASGTSNQSSSNCKMECPECKKEMTLKYLFSHIRNQHPGFFHQITTRKWLEDASVGSPLKLMWEVKDDFDDTKIIIIYGCLSSNKTFKSSHQAVNHFKKNKDALKDHNKQIKELMKVRKGFLASKKAIKSVDALALRFTSAMETDDPDVKAAFRLSLDQTFLACERLCEDTKGILTATTVSVDHPGMREQTVEETHKLFEKLKRDYSRPDCTIKYLRTLNQMLWRVVCLRDAILSNTNKDVPHYAYWKTDENPEGLLTKGTSEFSTYF
jgi:hypothetical protein